MMSINNIYKSGKNSDEQDIKSKLFTILTWYTSLIPFLDISFDPLEQFVFLVSPFATVYRLDSKTLATLSLQGMRQEFGSAGAGASWRGLGLKTAGAHSTRSGCKR